MGIIETVKQGRPIPCPVIDMHTHLGEYSLGGMHQLLRNLEDTVHVMDVAGIDCAVNSCAPLTFGDMALTNELTKEMVRAFPGRIYGAIFAAPHDGRDAVKKIMEKYVTEEGFVGVKIFTGAHGALDRREFEPMWEIANEGKFPVLCHMAGTSPGKECVLRILERYPDAVVILSHQGGAAADIPTFAERMKDSKLYLDTSSVNKMPIPKLVELCGADRLVYGSDYVVRDPRRELGKIVFSGISEENMKKLFAENYVNLMADSCMTKISL